MSHSTLPESRSARILRLFGPPPANWVRETDADHDVVVVGGGQAGLGIGFALRRAGVRRFTVIDAAGPDGTGAWTTIARMRTLRTPKAWPEPEFGFPELSFRAWYEQHHGDRAYLALDRIPRLDWAAYLRWITDTIDVPVRHRTRLVRIAPAGERLALTLQITTADGARTETMETTRQIVLANGVEGTGGPHLPAALNGLPSSLVAHTGTSIDFTALAGRQVAVLGAGASALDAAGSALEGGADEVHLFVRRDELIVHQSPSRTCCAPIWAGMTPQSKAASLAAVHQLLADIIAVGVIHRRIGRATPVAAIAIGPIAIAVGVGRRQQRAGRQAADDCPGPPSRHANARRRRASPRHASRRHASRHGSRLRDRGRQPPQVRSWQQESRSGIVQRDPLSPPWIWCSSLTSILG